MSTQTSQGGMSRWRGTIVLAVSGLVCLAAGGLAVAYAFFAYMAAIFDETGTPQIADAWWMAFVLWIGVAVMIGGPLLLWIVIPTMRWLRSRGRSNG